MQLKNQGPPVAVKQRQNVGGLLSLANSGRVAAWTQRPGGPQENSLLWQYLETCTVCLRMYCDFKQL